MSTLTELIKESLDGKLSDQIYASIKVNHNVINEKDTSQLLWDTLSIPRISDFAYEYEKDFNEVNSLCSFWYSKIDRNRDPIYFTYNTCGTSAGESAFNMLIGGNVISDKVLKSLGKLSVMERSGCKYMRFIPKNSDKIFFIFR